MGLRGPEVARDNFGSRYLLSAKSGVAQMPPLGDQDVIADCSVSFAITLNGGRDVFWVMRRLGVFERDREEERPTWDIGD